MRAWSRRPYTDTLTHQVQMFKCDHSRDAFEIGREHLSVVEKVTSSKVWNIFSIGHAWGNLNLTLSIQLQDGLRMVFRKGRTSISDSSG